jgi:hypothetical protein
MAVSSRQEFSMVDPGRIAASDEEIEALLLDRPVISLTDIAYTYGILDQLYTMGRYRESRTRTGSGDEEADIESYPFVAPPSEDHLRIMTPDARRSLFDTEDALLPINVALNPADETARIVESGEMSSDDVPLNTVTVEDLSWERMIDIGYLARPRKRGNVRDHSIPTHVNSKGPDKTAQYATERFTTMWLPQEAIEEEDGVLDRPDGWIPRQLLSIGDSDAHEQAHEAMVATVKSLESIQKNYTGLVSLRFWVEDDDEEGLVGPIYPGQLPIVKEISEWKLSTQVQGFSEAEDSTGKAADYLSGEVTDVLGTSPDRPAEYYMAKQLGSFQEFDADDSWQNYPLGRKSSDLVARGNRVLVHCRSNIANEIYVRYLPYIGRTMDAGDARYLYDLLHRVFRDDESIANVLAGELGSTGIPSGLRFYYILANSSGEKDKILNEQSQCSLLPIKALDGAHSAVLASNEVADRDDSPWAAINARPYLQGTYDESSEDTPTAFFDRERDQFWSILTYSYFDQTMVQPEKDRSEYVLDTDDDRLHALSSTLAGEHLSPVRVVRSYVLRAIRDQESMLGDSDTDATIPIRTLVKQSIQFSALERAGFFEQSHTTETGGHSDYPVALEHLATLPETMADDDTQMNDHNIDDQNPNDRTERLEQYIASHSTIRDSPAHRAGFLLGALTARLSAFQSNEGVAGTVARQYTIGRIRRRTFLKTFSSVADKNEEYVHAKGLYRMNNRYIDRIGDILTESMPDEWDISETELKAMFASGLSYGYADVSIDSDDESSETEGEPNADDQQARLTGAAE